MSTRVVLRRIISHPEIFRPWVMARAKRYGALRRGRILIVCLLVAYLSAVSLTSWKNDPASIEKWPLPVLGTGPFRNLLVSNDGQVGEKLEVEFIDKRVAFRIDLWSIDSMSSLDILTISSGENSLTITQEFGSLYAKASSSKYYNRIIVLEEVKSGRNQMLFVLDKFSTYFASDNPLATPKTISFTVSDSLHLAPLPSQSTQGDSSYGSIHVRIADLPGGLETYELFQQFNSSGHKQEVALHTFLLFLVISALVKIFAVTLRSFQKRMLKSEGGY
jgi:hypothetical protein